jgi:TonB family protein
MYRIVLGFTVFALAASAQNVSELLDSGLPTGKTCGPEEARVVGRHVTAPKAITTVQPKLTPEAIKEGRQGAVVLTGTVGADGHVCGNWHVRRSMGMDLDQNAVATITQWVFKPALEEGEKPVPATVTIEVNYRLLK